MEQLNTELLKYFRTIDANFRPTKLSRAWSEMLSQSTSWQQPLHVSGNQSFSPFLK